MPQKSMSEIMAELEAIQEKLNASGISSEMAEQLQHIMNSYVTVKEEIVKARDSQFFENAYQLLSEIKSISNKNTEMLSRFLRRFAVHIVRETLQLDKTISSPEDIVDRIQPINEEEY